MKTDCNNVLSALISSQEQVENFRSGIQECIFDQRPSFELKELEKNARGAIDRCMDELVEMDFFLRKQLAQAHDHTHVSAFSEGIAVATTADHAVHLIRKDGSIWAPEGEIPEYFAIHRHSAVAGGHIFIDGEGKEQHHNALFRLDGTKLLNFCYSQTTNPIRDIFPQKNGWTVLSHVYGKRDHYWEVVDPSGKEAEDIFASDNGSITFPSENADLIVVKQSVQDRSSVYHIPTRTWLCRDVPQLNIHSGRFLIYNNSTGHNATGIYHTDGTPAFFSKEDPNKAAFFSSVVPVSPDTFFVVDEESHSFLLQHPNKSIELKTKEGYPLHSYYTVALFDGSISIYAKRPEAVYRFSKDGKEQERLLIEPSMKYHSMEENGLIRLSHGHNTRTYGFYTSTGTPAFFDAQNNPITFESDSGRYDGVFYNGVASVMTLKSMQKILIDKSGPLFGSFDTPDSYQAIIPFDEQGDGFLCYQTENVKHAFFVSSRKWLHDGNERLNVKEVRPLGGGYYAIVHKTTQKHAIFSKEGKQVFPSQDFPADSIWFKGVLSYKDGSFSCLDDEGTPVFYDRFGRESF